MGIKKLKQPRVSFLTPIAIELAAMLAIVAVKLLFATVVLLVVAPQNGEKPERRRTQ